MVAGSWAHQTFLPLRNDGQRVGATDLPVVYVSESILRREFSFEDIQDFAKACKEQHAQDQDGRRRQRSALWFPNFDHFVLLLPPANAQEQQVCARYSSENDIEHMRRTNECRKNTIL